jgi:hypothetical protein
LPFVDGLHALPARRTEDDVAAADFLPASCPVSILTAMPRAGCRSDGAFRVRKPYHVCPASGRQTMSNKQNQWVVGVNAVASAIDNDAEHVREVLVEAGSKNPRLAEIEAQALRKDIEVRKVNAQALDGGRAVAPSGRGGTLCRGQDLGRARAGRAGRTGRRQGLAAGAGWRAGPAQPRRLSAQRGAAGVTAVVIPKDKSATVNATVRKTRLAPPTAFRWWRSPTCRVA